MMSNKRVSELLLGKEIEIVEALKEGLEWKMVWIDWD